MKQTMRVVVYNGGAMDGCMVNVMDGRPLSQAMRGMVTPLIAVLDAASSGSENSSPAIVFSKHKKGHALWERGERTHVPGVGSRIQFEDSTQYDVELS